MLPRRRLIPGLLWLGAQAARAAGLSAYQTEIEKWRKDREARLKTDDGWLTVAGLFWLKEGPNRFGSNPGNDIVLPASAPAQAGVFELRSGKIILTRTDAPGRTSELRSDLTGSPGNGCRARSMIVGLIRSRLQ